MTDYNSHQTLISSRIQKYYQLRVNFINIFITKIMKYTSPYKKPANKNSSFEFAIKQQPQANPQSGYLSHFRPIPNFQSVHSKSQDISYFKQTKYKVADPVHNKSINGPTKKMVAQVSHNHFRNINNLLQNINNKHQQMKKKIQQLKQRKQDDDQNDNECTFAPRINNNPRYFIPSSLQERIISWGQAKVRHCASIKQEIVQSEIKQCTFSPKIVSKPQSKKLLKNREIEDQRIKQKIRDKGFEEVTFRAKYGKAQARNDTNKSKDSKVGKSEYKNIQQIIKYEMSRIKFTFE